MQTKQTGSVGVSRHVALSFLLGCFASAAWCNASQSSVVATEQVRQSLEGVEELTLAHAQRIALAHNPSLLAAGARMEQALAAVSEARAAYWPRLDLSAGASHVDLADSSYGGSPLGDPDEYYSVGLTASYTLFDGCARRLAAAIAEHGRDAAGFAEADVRRLTLLSVAAAYYSAQLAEANLRIAKADEVFFARQLKDAEARRKAGTGRMSDKLSFEVRLNSAKSAVLQAELERRRARIALAAILACDAIPETVSIAELRPETAADLATPEEAHLLRAAQENRPDILRAVEVVNQAHASVGMARAGWMPALSVSGAYDLERAGDSSFDGDDAGYTVGVALSLNILDGGLTRARVRAARASEKEARLALREAAIGARRDVREHYETLLSAQQQVLLQRSTAELVESTRDLVEKEYAKGQASLVRLTEAQRDMTAAQGRLAGARARMRLAWSELRAAAGEVATQVAANEEEAKR